MFPIFRNKKESEKSFLDRVLQNLINYKIIYLEYQDEVQLSTEDYEEVQITIIKKIGSLEKLLDILKN